MSAAVLDDISLTVISEHLSFFMLCFCCFDFIDKWKRGKKLCRNWERLTLGEVGFDLKWSDIGFIVFLFFNTLIHFCEPLCFIFIGAKTWKQAKRYLDIFFLRLSLCLLSADYCSAFSSDDEQLANLFNAYHSAAHVTSLSFSPSSLLALYEQRHLLTTYSLFVSDAVIVHFLTVQSYTYSCRFQLYSRLSVSVSVSFWAASSSDFPLCCQ